MINYSEVPSSETEKGKSIICTNIIDCGFWENVYSKYHSEFIQISPDSENNSYSLNVRSIRNTIIYNYKFKDFLMEKIKMQ